MSFYLIKALPSFCNSQCRIPSLSIKCKHHEHSHNVRTKKNQQKPIDYLNLKKSSLAVQIGAILATVEPAMAVTGENNREDLVWVLIQLGIVAFWYFLIMPPIIMNWLRIRWYRRKLGEMYLQFMFVFMFFPGILLWAPFLNFRKFPRDPDMKYPWSTPDDPTKIKNDYLKFPWAKPEDYS
uniref:NADH dehydrogenase-like complex L n=1 Tax=Francoa sonchifolia TaxID=23250 RepID=A0A0F7CYX7_9ROSI